MAEGTRVRREVLGAEYVDRNKGVQSRLQLDFQEYTVEQAWSAVWTRPGLERKTRSMLNLAMLTALGRLHELEVHMRGAITNGVSETEVSSIGSALECAEVRLAMLTFDSAARCSECIRAPASAG